MADAAVNILFQHLSDLLVQEASLLSGVRDEVEDIKMELDSMRACLRDADRRKDSNDGVRAWVGQVRDAAYDVEDIVDEFMYRMDGPPRSGLSGCLLETICIPRDIFNRHQLATLLQGLKNQIATISARKDRYPLSNIEEGSLYNANERWQHHGETSFYMDDDEIIGLKERVELVVGWLTKEEPRRTAISVVGMGGLGKTTLVAKTYKNQMVKKLFECCVWVSVSQSYRVEELLRSIIKDLFHASEVEVPSDLDSLNRRQLLQMVNNYLDAKRYFVVLDDVWTLDAWTEINIAFPRNRCGSRIILTTRHESVASALGDGSHQYQLEPLNENIAWELFSRKAFWREPCPSELQPLARKIVERCEGLPLAIVALGSLLSLKPKTSLEWDLFYRNLSWESTNDQMLERMKQVLLLSIYDLPYRLKHCFLYCCIFPAAYLIHRKRLIRLWVAEGFVEDRGIITMEEAAEGYLKELIHRNMLQVARMNTFGRVKACRVHDLMREVALSLSDDEQFCMTYNGQLEKQDDKVRRISIYNTGRIIQSSTSLSRIRSVLVFDESMSFSSSLNKMASGFRLLRVLNLECVSIESVPAAVADLFNLTYLNLRKSMITELPKSIGRLQNLQTLDVRDTRLKKLPSEIVKLQKLRHLFCYRYNHEKAASFDYFSSIEVHVGICKITSLQSLADIKEDQGQIAKKVGNLTELRRFGIFNVGAMHGSDLCMSIGKMKHLLTLGVKAVSHEETLQLEALSPHPPPLLQKLCLRGHLEKVPQWFSSLVNLCYLELFWSRLREDPLSLLHALPNLVRLQLVKAYEGEQLQFHSGWFPKLKILILCDFTQLRQVVIGKDAMPSIQHLHLVRCGELKMIPQGIEYLTSLQELYLEEIPIELLEKLRQKDGEEYKRVGHISSILHRCWKEEEGWVVDQLN